MGININIISLVFLAIVSSPNTANSTDFLFEFSF